LPDVLSGVWPEWVAHGTSVLTADGKQLYRKRDARYPTDCVATRTFNPSEYLTLPSSEGVRASERLASATEFVRKHTFFLIRTPCDAGNPAAAQVLQYLASLQPTDATSQTNG
jgi:hypothetical protein